MKSFTIQQKLMEEFETKSKYLSRSIYVWDPEKKSYLSANICHIHCQAPSTESPVQSFLCATENGAFSSV